MALEFLAETALKTVGKAALKSPKINAGAKMKIADQVYGDGDGDLDWDDVAHFAGEIVDKASDVAHIAHTAFEWLFG